MKFQICREAPPIQLTHIVDSVARDGGGPSYSVPALCAALARNGTPVRLRAIESHGQSDMHLGCEGLHIHPGASDTVGRTVRASPDLQRALSIDADAGAILHVHGLWLMANIYPARAARQSAGAAKLIHAPRGMLGRAAFEISAWKKRPFWWLFQLSALKAANCLHATAMSEYEEIRAAGLANPVAIISNGIDLPVIPVIPRKVNQRVALSLGRIHPKKGLDRLVRAWAQIEHEAPLWSLRIIGPAELNHDQELRRLAQSLGTQRINIEGAVYGDAKVAAYRAADLFVLPTLNENFAITVAEALAAKIPVISTKGAPWAGLEQHRCGWWIDHGVEPLVRALRTAMAIPPDELHAMGTRGCTWMENDFGWDKIARDMLNVYRWLKVGGEPPATVHLD